MDNIFLTTSPARMNKTIRNLLVNKPGLSTGWSAVDAAGCLDMNSHFLQLGRGECLGCGAEICLDSYADCAPDAWQAVPAAWNRVAQGKPLGSRAATGRASGPLTGGQFQPTLKEFNRHAG